MKIALLGVPGAGKSALSRALFHELHGVEPHDNAPFMIVDDYVPQLEGEIDLSLGKDATYIGNLHIALRRESLERRFINSITCGTLLETAAYTAMGFEEEQNLASPEEQQDLLLRIEATFRVLASLYMDTFHYDYAFYLPNRSDNDVYVRLDRNLQAAINAFNLVKVYPLLSENLRESADNAISIIKGEYESPAEGQDADVTSSV